MIHLVDRPTSPPQRRWRSSNWLGTTLWNSRPVIFAFVCCGFQSFGIYLQHLVGKPTWLTVTEGTEKAMYYWNCCELHMFFRSLEYLAVYKTKRKPAQDFSTCGSAYHPVSPPPGCHRWSRAPSDISTELPPSAFRLGNFTARFK